MSSQIFNENRLELIKLVANSYDSPVSKKETIVNVFQWLQRAFEDWLDTAALHYAFDRLWKEYYDAGADQWDSPSHMRLTYEDGKLKFLKPDKEKEFLAKLFEYCRWFQNTTSFADFMNQEQSKYKLTKFKD